MAQHHRDRDRHRRAGSTSTRSPSTSSRTALRNARYEMDEVLFRTALSPGIREQHDEFPLIADPDGKMVVGQFGLSIPDFLDGFDGDIEEGDVLLTSDPYACGAAISHANDWLVVMPIFHEGRVVGWASMFGHMSDVGGKTPSSMPTDARTIFEEGVVIPPFKLYAKGVLNEDALRIILNQVRDARLEPRRPQRPRRRLPHGRAAGSSGDVRPVRHRHLPLRARRAAAAQLRRDEGAAARWSSRRARRSRSPTTSATTASATAPTS